MAKRFLTVDNSELLEFTEKFKSLRESWGDSISDMIKVIALKFLQDVKARTPKDTGELRTHWDSDNATIHVESDGHGYWVYLVNKAEYALEVEQGHYSYNQFNKGGEPYIVKNRTILSNKYGNNNDATFVYGVFYLKETEIQYDEGKLDRLVRRELNKILKSKGW